MNGSGIDYTSIWLCGLHFEPEEASKKSAYLHVV
jgi:hypothetical protein